MLTVQYLNRNGHDEYGDPEEVNYVSIDGNIDLESFYSKLAFSYVSLKNADAIRSLMNYSFNEVGEEFVCVYFPEHHVEWEYTFEVTIWCKSYRNEKSPLIRSVIQLPLIEFWDHPFSINKLARTVKNYITNSIDKKFSYWENEGETVLNGFGIEYAPNNGELNILDEYNSLLKFLQDLATAVTHKLLTENENAPIISYFKFPDEIRTSCNQYLMYFSQFLADCGITADTEIKEGINETLFKVVPRDKEESLDKIREALAIYLNIPTNPNFNKEASKNTDVAVMQLQSIVLNLQSQLMLAKSMYQLNQATIESLQLNNFQLKGIVESNVPTPNDDEEALIKDLVSVKDIDLPGISIKLPAFVRNLKRRFWRK